MKITIWSTLPAWDSSYYMEAQPAHIWFLFMIGVVSLNATGIYEILIYHLMIRML